MRYLILIVILFSSLIIRAQKDIIYPSIGKASIRKCTITEVKEGNMVYYIKDSVSNVIEAVSIRRNGKYITLERNISANNNVSPQQPEMYKGFDYSFYEKQYKRAIKTRNLGIGITIFGLSTGIASSLILKDDYSNGEAPRPLLILYYGGGIAASIGIITWISGGIKASNNKRAMKMARKSIDLSLGLTDNGVGLLLTFNK